MFHASEVVSDKDPASLTIDSDAVFAMLGIFGRCSREAEVDRQSLAWTCRNAGRVWSCWNFCLFCLNACGTLIQNSGLTIKFWHTCDVFVRIAEAFVAWMSKPLVPQQLFRPRSNRTDRDSFINDHLETPEIDSFQSVRHGSKRIVELLVFRSFDDSNLCIDSMLADIDKRCILCASEVEGVSKGCCRTVCIHIREDQRMSAQLSSKKPTMDDCVASLRAPVMTDNGHVSS